MVLYAGEVSTAAMPPAIATLSMNIATATMMSSTNSPVSTSSSATQAAAQGQKAGKRDHPPLRPLEKRISLRFKTNEIGLLALTTVDASATTVASRVRMRDRRVIGYGATTGTRSRQRSLTMAQTKAQRSAAAKKAAATRQRNAATDAGKDAKAAAKRATSVTGQAAKAAGRAVKAVGKAATTRAK
jgi:hypothetical protein